MSNLKNYEVTEMCPHCETEITLCWDVESDGYQVFCPECGRAVMLCSMCDRSPCDWSEQGCKHSKDNYATINNYGWIPVEDRLPDKSDDLVLIQVNGKPKENITLHNALELACYIAEGNEGWILEEYPEWENPDVLAWRPLPEPYRPE